MKELLSPPIVFRGALLGALLALSPACGQDRTFVVEETPTAAATTPTPTGPTPFPHPAIELSTEALTFGEQGVGCVVNRSVTVYNRGQGNLGVSAPTFAVGSDPDFSTASGPVNITAGGSADLTVTFSVGEEGEAEGLLLIASNDPSNGTVAVDLSGEGAPLEWETESFLQESSGQVDILIGLDVTQYAKELMVPLVLNLPLLEEALNSRGLDWQMGWITLDPAEGAAMKGSFGEPARPYITADDEGGIEALQASMGERLKKVASSLTPGLKLTSAALSEANLAGPHAGFIREDAQLLVAVFTVYDDDSQTPSQELIPVTDYRNALFAVKGGDSEKVRFVAITGSDQSGCAREDGYRYRALLDSGVSGFTDDICFQAWSDSLDRLGEEALSLGSAFTLEGRPGYVELIEVTVGGATIPRDAANGYTFDVDSNTLTLHGAAIPDSGVSISVRYPLPGICD